MARKEGTLGNEAAQGMLRAEEKVRQERAKGDLQAVMATVEGRRFVWQLLEDDGTFGPSFATDALATAYNEGRRSRGLALMFRLQAEVPELYVQALQEALESQKQTRSTKDAAEVSVETRTEEVA